VLIAGFGFLVVRSYSLTLTMFVDSRPAEFLNSFEQDAALFMALAAGALALATAQHDDALDAIATVMIMLGLIAAAGVAVFVWFLWQWGDVFTWTLPASPHLVVVMMALTGLGAFSLPVSPALPEVPITLPIAAGTAILFALVRRSRRRDGNFR
jgi:hypothetical protein